MSETDRPLVRRVLSLELDQFKGFGGGNADRPDYEPKPLDLDADIVLLAGPNGYGKSSVIEALEVLFTGGFVDRRQPVTARKAKTADWAALVNEHSQEAVLTAEVAWSATEEEGPQAGAEERQPGVRPKVKGLLRRTGESQPTDLGGRLSAVVRGEVDLEDPAHQRLLRDAAFFYQDGVNAFLGLADAARRQIVEYLVPEPQLFSVLRSVGGAMAADGRARLKALGQVDDPEEVEAQCGRAARELEDAANTGSERAYKLVRKGTDKLLTDEPVARDLRKLAEAAGVDSDNVAKLREDRTTWGPALASIAAAAREKATVLRQARADAPQLGVPPTWLKALRPDTPSPAALDEQAQGVGQKETLEAAVSTRLADEQRLKAVRRLLVGEAAGSGEDGADAGVASLLQGVLALHKGGCAEVARVAGPESSLACAVGKIVAAASAEEVRKALGEAEALIQRTANEAGLVERELRGKRDDLAARQTVDAQMALHAEIEAWLAANHPGRRLRDFVSAEDASRLDDSALTGVAPGGLEVGVDDEAGKWEAVVSAADRWGEREEKRQKALEEAQETRRARLQCFTNLTSRLAAPEFATDVRAALVDSEYSADLDDCVRRIMSRFAVHYHLRRKVETRLGGTSGLTVSLPKGKAAAGRDYRSLSTGQFNALCMAISMVFSLRRPDNPLGFVCLDDVSSAFDLDNLACDAAVIRALAYAEDESQRRQVILATHHDELTDRLLPLLRPPRGKTLKVLHFKDWSRHTGPEIEPWECIAGQAEPEAVIRLWELRHQGRAAAG